MQEQTSASRKPPRGLQRLLWRAPIWLYKLHLGGLLGQRFLLLTHTGRKSGKPRQAVIEIDDYDPQTNSYLIASGFGRQSDWYRNIRKTPQVMIQVGNRQMAARAEPLSPEQSGEAMVTYAHKHPTAARNLAKMIGLDVDGSDESYRAAARDHVPFVRLHVLSNAEG
ncbi:MAG: nitroreductase family deazaflavin-dependent oxidoreductase [Chloroflexota bacterium]|nr:nitroreductase family deazaflavin-dependent oxidoreductase [Chloroflexota bacterium]